MDYSVTFKASALKQVEKLPQAVGQRIVTKATALGSNPRPTGSIKLAGGGNFWRVRVGDYRIVYVIDDTRHTVDIRIVAHRREVYRDM